MKKATNYLFALLILLYNTTLAQTSSDDLPNLEKKKFSLTGGVESNLLQIASVSAGGVNLPTVLRYSYFFNMGVDVNFNLSDNISPFTGFHLKNIGIITKPNDSIKFKERVYVLSAPIGLRVFNYKRNIMFKAGADAGLAINYKIKTFFKENKVSKQNEYFSTKANLFFASIFAGVQIHGIAVTCNYYLTNFYSPNTTNAIGKIFTIGIGIMLDEESPLRKHVEKISK